MCLGLQYNSLGEYCGPRTASSVRLIIYYYALTCVLKVYNLK